MTDLDNAAPKVDTSTDHMSCVAQNLRGLTHFRKNADDIDALADERDALQSQVELLRKERDVLLDALIDIEGRSRLHNPTGNPKWINDHAREALANTTPKEGE